MQWGPTAVGTMVAEGWALGAAFGVGLWCALWWPAMSHFGAFVVLLSLFHTTEFLFVALYHHKDVSIHSFLIPHSREYSMAMCLALAEHVLECWLWPSLKSPKPIWLMLTFAFTLCAQGLRWLAFVTAQHNFTHRIADRHTARHVLVTTGVYNYIRHPGYCGWFWWSVGTQLVLCNPLSFCAYAYASYTFFVDRIANEEDLLCSRDFFGEDYVAYRRTTRTYIPGIP